MVLLHRATVLTESISTARLTVAGHSDHQSQSVLAEATHTLHMKPRSIVYMPVLIPHLPSTANSPLNKHTPMVKHLQIMVMQKETLAGSHDPLIEVILRTCLSHTVRRACFAATFLAWSYSSMNFYTVVISENFTAMYSPLYRNTTVTLS